MITEDFEFFRRGIEKSLWGKRRHPPTAVRIRAGAFFGLWCGFWFCGFFVVWVCGFVVLVGVLWFWVLVGGFVGLWVWVVLGVGLWVCGRGEPTGGVRPFPPHTAEKKPFFARENASLPRNHAQHDAFGHPTGGAAARVCLCSEDAFTYSFEQVYRASYRSTALLTNPISTIGRCRNCDVSHVIRNASPIRAAGPLGTRLDH